MTFGLVEQCGRVHTRRISWSERDAALYALGISAVENPLDQLQLRLVGGADQITFLTFATSLARNAAPSLGDLGGNYKRSMLLAQLTEFHRPVPASGSAVATSEVIAVRDRGTDRGAVIAVQTRLIDEAGTALATATALLLARGDGGCGSSNALPPTLPPVPARPCDTSVVIPTRTDQAILYALSGDANPLHLDPVEARKRGFERPVLHGLCTYAIAARAILSTVFGRDSGSLESLHARFLMPVFPGEALRIDLWRDGDRIAFQGFAVDRNVRVLGDGTACLRL
jgi:acyl dehydratase